MASTIKAKLTRASTVITLIALVTAGSALVVYYGYSYRVSIDRTLVLQASTISLNAVPALRFDDPESARQTLSALSADRNLILAVIGVMNQAPPPRAFERNGQGH